MTIREIILLKNKNACLPLIGYLPAGYPSRRRFSENVASLAAEGIRLLEIGVPEEEPSLDGSIIADALKQSASQGIGLWDAIDIGGNETVKHGIAGICMLYYKAFLQADPYTVLSRIKESGLKGLLIPNMPLSERKECFAQASAMGIELIGFIPAWADERTVKGIVESAGGFIYFQSYEGSTGQRFLLDGRLAARFPSVKTLASELDLPVAIGFGIHTADDVLQVKSLGADAAVIGTALVEAAGKSKEALKDYLAELQRNCSSLSA